jgi:hypothetical protein
MNETEEEYWARYKDEQNRRQPFMISKPHGSIQVVVVQKNELFIK